MTFQPRVPTGAADHVLHFRSTEAEEASYRSAARSEGVSLSTWIRDSLAKVAMPPASTVEPSLPQVVAVASPIPTAPPTPEPATYREEPVATLPTTPTAFVAMLREAARTRFNIKPGVVLASHLKSAVAPTVADGEWQRRLSEAASLGLVAVVTIAGRPGNYIKLG